MSQINDALNQLKESFPLLCNKQYQTTNRVLGVCLNAGRMEENKQQTLYSDCNLWEKISELQIYRRKSKKFGQP